MRHRWAKMSWTAIALLLASALSVSAQQLQRDYDSTTVAPTMKITTGPARRATSASTGISTPTSGPTAPTASTMKGTRSRSTSG